MLMRQAALTVAFVVLSPVGFATNTTATPTQGAIVPAVASVPTSTTPTETVAIPVVATTTTNTQTVAPNTTPALRQNQPAAAPLPPTLASLQQKHNQALALQEKRLNLLEQANQEALAKNQQLQISNDSLAGQVQVLQSERSVQMFLYGAVTFGLGILCGIIIYSVLTSRRRRSW